jgi:hypothetical protein
MTRRVHTITGERRETSKAWQAFCDYRDLPPGQRSLSKLAERYRTITETPPTRSLQQLKEWSAAFAWQARCAVHDAEQDARRQAEMQRQIEARARQDAELLHSVGAARLAWPRLC